MESWFLWAFLYLRVKGDLWGLGSRPVDVLWVEDGKVFFRLSPQKLLGFLSREGKEEGIKLPLPLCTGHLQVGNEFL